jgi:hypothetical protein
MSIPVLTASSDVERELDTVAAREHARIRLYLGSDILKNPPRCHSQLASFA